MPGRDQARQRLLGIGLVVLAAVFFAFIDGFSKLLSDTASVAQIVWARYTLAVPVLILMTGPAKLPTLLGTTRPGLLILRGLTPLAVSTSMAFGVRYLPLAETTVILFAAPFLVVALSVPMLGEKVHASHWIAVAVGFAAVLLVARPGYSALSHFALFPLAGAFFNALQQLVTRKVAATGERAGTTLAWTLLTGMAVSTPAAIRFWQPLDLEGWTLMLAVGTVFGFSQLMMIRGFAHAPAAMLTPLSYVQIISAVIFGVVVFGESPDLCTVLGIVMIVGSGIYVVRRRRT
jgi:drug/metabolite transporter (DMT)-like permease